MNEEQEKKEEVVCPNCKQPPFDYDLKEGTLSCEKCKENFVFDEKSGGYIPAGKFFDIKDNEEVIPWGGVDYYDEAERELDERLKKDAEKSFSEGFFETWGL